jgi:hypothetical protein
MPHDLIENAASWCDLCHGAAKEAGWWNDLQTGEPVVRNTGEILMLAVSEITEAIEAWENRAMDDKLPTRRGVEVELADFCIRTFDTMTGLGHRDAFVLALDTLDRRNVPCVGADGGPPGEKRFFGIVRHLADAMEADRKKAMSVSVPTIPGLVMHTAQAVRATIKLATLVDADLPGAMRDKLAYNAQREDHKVENRRVAGGKAY